MKKAIVTDKAPKAIGPYSQGMIFGNLVFSSGQIAINPQTGQFEEGPIQNQAARTFTNLMEIIKASGSRPENIIKVTVYLKNMDDFAKMNEVYTEYFKGNFPARAVVEVSRLPKDAAIEVEAIAYL